MARNGATLLAGAALAVMTWIGSGSSGWCDPALDQALKSPNNWPMYGRDYTNDRYSPLKEIDAQNVGNLKLAWAFQLGTLEAQEASPVIIDGTLYVSSSSGPTHVFALDAATGQIQWQYDPKVAADVPPYVCCGLDSRGVSFADGKILFSTLDGYLVALDAKTGKEAWKVKVVDYKDGAAITSPPLIVKNMAILGYAGGEYGMRGALQAFDLSTGKQLWKTWTIPGPGQRGNDTWKGDSWKHGGGNAWLVGSYDPKSNTVFYGTSNPGPWNAAVRSTGTSSYGKLTDAGSSATLAIDPDNGNIKWEIQSTPADAWDYDGVNELVLGNVEVDGHETPIYMKADRDGFFFVANRDTGKLLSAEPFVPVNWAKSFDAAADRPIENPAKRPRMNYKAADICPAWIGGKNWQPMSYNPVTGLAYIPANNMCQTMEATKADYHRGMFYLGDDFSVQPGHGGYLGQLLAWNPVTQKAAWTINRPLPWNGGTMTTAGDLVFQGDIEGVFHAYNARTGAELFHKYLGSGIIAGPVTFAVGDKQYVAILTGRPVGPPAYMGEPGKKILAATPQGGTLFVFSL